MWINISRRFTPSLWRVISRCGGKKKKHSLARTRSPINEHADFTAQKILKSSLPRCWPLSIAPVSDFISFQTCHTLNRATFCPQRSRDKIRKTTDEWIERSLPRLCLFVHEGRREKKEGKKIRDYKNSSRRGSLGSTTTRSIKRTILLMRILNATKKEKKRKGHWHFRRVKSVLIPIKNAMMDNLLARGDLSRFIFRENRERLMRMRKKWWEICSSAWGKETVWEQLRDWPAIRFFLMRYTSGIEYCARQREWFWVVLVRPKC